MSFWCHRLDPKYQRKNLTNSALKNEKWSNHRIKAFYNVFNTLDSPYNHILLISPLFKFYGRNCQIFSLVFWSKRWHQKDILKLTDLYKPQPQWKMGKKIQATSYNCARTVFELYEYLGTKKKINLRNIWFPPFSVDCFYFFCEQQRFLDVFAFLTALITLKVV